MTYHTKRDLSETRIVRKLKVLKGPGFQDIFCEKGYLVVVVTVRSNVPLEDTTVKTIISRRRPLKGVLRVEGFDSLPKR